MNFTPQAQYTLVVETLCSNPDVTQSKKRGLGAGLRIHGKVFAMLAKGKLVVKLPQQRVQALIAAGEGEPYYAGNGRMTKEWVAIDPTSAAEWLPLASEAMEFVAT